MPQRMQQMAHDGKNDDHARSSPADAPDDVETKGERPAPRAQEKMMVARDTAAPSV